MKAKIGMLSLGCARNLVDAEVILGHLKKAGFKISDQVADSDLAIVNTCCFVKDAKEESVDSILKLCQLKEEGKIKAVVVCGCLAQRYKQDLVRELSEVDAFLGVGDIDKIVSIVKKLLKGAKISNRFSKPEFLYSHTSPREFITPRHFAYVKISEGCHHNCSYCIIPAIRGKHRSRPMNSILHETDFLVNKRGVSEINLIGQDTTAYGLDLYKHGMIDVLLKKVADQAKNKWVRLLYAHPLNISKKLIKVIKDKQVICKYIDLPIQHISDKILMKMNRKGSSKQILKLLETLRGEIPDLAIRTTLIVGFPGETDKDFKQLLDFMQDMRFERLGLFKYSKEESTPAYNLRPQITEQTKEARFDQAFKLQQKISTEINQKFLGKTLKVLIDQKNETDVNIFLGRTEYDAPEVDGCVYVKTKKHLLPGDFVEVKITDTLEYDLVGEIE